MPMKKPNMMAVILFLTGLLCVAGLFLLNGTTLRQTQNTEQDLEKIMESVSTKHTELKEAEERFAQDIKEREANIKRLRQKARNVQQPQETERAEIADEEFSGPSVFAPQDEEELFSSEEGHVVVLDPGHQSETIDMSGMEPNGPGSSEMKAKCTTGTVGAYTGVPEYRLNLEISLKLKDALEQRGYRVLLTRTDNETAISNKERAEFAAEQDADICVRIHANGEETGTVSGALTMAPSETNPYVSQLFPESDRLSRCIVDSYCAVTGLPNLGVQYYDNMTGINWSTIPVTILEMGFMSNEHDDTQMNDPSFRETMVNGIADGIDAYFGENTN